MTLIVCSLRRLPEVVAARAPSHLITLLAPETLAETTIAAPQNYLAIGVHDIPHPQPGMVAPSPETIEQIVAFGRTWDERAPMVVHCFAGLSRSTATAFVLACERNPGVDERTIARALRRASPFAAPNPRIVALADDMLGRQGRMLEALEAMGEAEPTSEGEPFELPARH
jgi:predicted protein tyrosine phosphatase